MSLISEQFRCEACDHVWGDLVERAERDAPVKCPRCDEGWGKRMMAAPTVMNAALPDGARRDSSWERAKRYAELQVAHANASTPSEAADVKKEMSKV